MGLLQVMTRGDEKTQRFEEALCDIEDAIGEAIEIYDEMEAQFSERSGNGGEGNGYTPQMRRRMNRRSSMRERHGRR